MATAANLGDVVSNLMPLLIVSVGQTIVLITGGIDLSVTAIIGLSSVCGAFVMSSDYHLLGAAALATPAGIGVMLAVGGLLGLVNGAAVARLRMPPFIVTLTVMMFFSGLAIWVTRSRNIYHLPESFHHVGSGSMFGLSNPLWLALLTAGCAHFALHRTLLGRWLFACGLNARAAAVCGVPVAKVTSFAYVLSGFSGALASILYSSRLETGSPVMGQRIFLDVIAATVIGGTSLFGGRGKVLWTVFGVLFITILDNSLNLLGLTNFMVLMVKGAVILAAALMDGVRRA
jgi:ribose/xylose/arabinose/galactoside ABC-type transport system permease subunit